MKILITGGASGLGEAITRLLAQDGQFTVFFTYSNSVEKAKQIESDLANTRAIKCDFKNTEEVNALVEQVKEMELDVLINNAFSGEAIKTYFHKISPDDFLTDFSVNIIPSIAITQAAINNFRKKKSGKIITVLTSFLLNTPPIGSSVYVANKAYLASLTKSWATENIKFNISSNSVSPAFMQTNLTAAVDERVIEQIKDTHPLKQILTVDEVAKTVLFLVNASAQINGMDIVLNAGVNVKG